MKTRSRDLRGLDALIGMTAGPGTVVKTPLPAPAPPPRSGGAGTPGTQPGGTPPPKVITPGASGRPTTPTTPTTPGGALNPTKSKPHPTGPSPRAQQAAAHAKQVAARLQAVAKQINKRNGGHASKLTALANNLASRASRITSASTIANAKQQRGIVGGLVGDDTIDPTADPSILDGVTTIADIAASAYALWDQVVAASTQLQNAGNTSLAQAAHPVAIALENAGDWSTNYTTPATTQNATDVANNVQSMTSLWTAAQQQGQAYLQQAQAAGSTVTDDAGYVAKLQALVAQMTPQVQQLQAAGQAQLAMQGQAIVDQANSVIAQWQQTQAGLPGSGTIQQQRGAM